MDHSATRPAGAQSSIRTFVGVGAGNAMEWFDWGIYATFATFFASQFFASGDSGADLLRTLAIFAVGFVARPFGGALFGWLADRKGRQLSMALTVALAGGGSLVIGLTPTYSSIGIAAPLILLLARLAQGLAHGGELPAAQTYVAEMAPPERRGQWSSLIYVSGSVGVLGGTLLGAVLSGLLSPEQMTAFGWRIPFVLGGVFGLYALVMRLRLRESDTFLDAADPADAPDAERLPTSFWRALVANPMAMLRVIGLTVGLTISYYVWAISAPAYAISARGVDPQAALWAGTGATVVFMAALPLWGRLSDRVGRRPALIVAGVLLAVLLFPLDALAGTSAWTLFLATSIALALVAAGAAIVPALYAELFPTGIRAAGMGVPYSVAVAAFGGTAPYLQSYFAGIGSPALFTGYAVVALAVSVLTVLTMPETKGRDLRQVRKSVARP
ncbi:MFS transporter [Pseudonocardia kunmingensis]|uniref:MHS family alpha-ketoglutarate permease-like MFS transporter n=1 Tax=Pseudonocardia kunmingensis TaxID=630975 RepID=A0A543DIU7_9PSEU|nr:MFS transporter [Pseudonocardia kunmingensis]TQM09231.1 MHS family alpha-ketoglutarate permease-like MFS transporter [Pseudonocardia kunmingensis]